MPSVLPIINLVKAIVRDLLVLDLPGFVVEGGVDGLIEVSADGLADALGGVLE